MTNLSPYYDDYVDHDHSFYRTRKSAPSLSPWPQFERLAPDEGYVPKLGSRPQPPPCPIELAMIDVLRERIAVSDVQPSSTFLAWAQSGARERKSRRRRARPSGFEERNYRPSSISISRLLRPHPRQRPLSLP